MGTTLTGTTPQDTYDSLIKVTDNGPLSGTAKYLSDGLGNDSILALSTSRVGIGETSPTATLNIKATSSNNSDNLSQVLTNSEFRLQYRADDVSSLYIGGLGSERGFLQGVNGAQNAGAGISLNPYGGNVGIGTSSPSSTLEVAGVAKATFSVLTSENSISSAAEASRFFAVSGDTGATSYNGTSIGQAGISGFTSTGVFVVGGFKPILPKGWTGTVVLEAVCNNANFATQVFIQTSTDGSSWTTRATASVNGTLTYTASSGLSADNFLRILLVSGSGAPVSENVCQFSNLRINSYNVLMDAFHQGQIKYPSLGIASLSGGLAFNGDTAAANALDDYEEGTFTMTATPADSGTITLNPSNNTARYTKIGRQVTIQAFVTISAVSSPVGSSIILGGLPFTIANTNAAAGSGSVAWADASASYVRSVLPAIFFANTTLLYASINASTLASPDELFINMTYTV